MKWTTATGEKLDIKDMATSHIENCIKMLNNGINALENEILQYEDHYMGSSFTVLYWRGQIEEWEKKIKIFKRELKKRT